ncbi:MAG TPA: chorismate mutase [Actinomycetota bacterium]|jgi:chorismate mutase|nr:chorismate mutase [Actinomycetota bacterium]
MSTETESRLRALRGATTVDSDEASAIVAATTELLTEILGRNQVLPEDVVSVLFTATDDLSAEFPAVAARSVGLSEVPLMCAREMPVPGSVRRCIRVMMHLYTKRAAQELDHVYLHGASHLRSGLVSGT